MTARNKEFRYWVNVPAEERVTPAWLKEKAVRLHQGPDWIQERLVERADQCQAAVYLRPDPWQHRCLQRATHGGLCKSHHTAMKRSLEVAKAEPAIDLAQLDIALAALDVEHADTVVVSVDVSEKGYGLIREHVKALFPGKRVLVLGMATKIEALSSADMAKLGWVRV